MTKLKQLDTELLAQTIVAINFQTEDFNQWLEDLKEVFLKDKRDLNTEKQIAFELGCVRHALYYLLSQKRYLKLYPNSKKLAEMFKTEIPGYYESVYGSHSEETLSLFNLRLLSYEAAFDSKEIFISLGKLLNCFLVQCVEQDEPLSFQVSLDSDIMKQLQPDPDQIDCCMQIVENLVKLADRTFKEYEIVEQYEVAE